MEVVNATGLVTIVLGYTFVVCCLLFVVQRSRDNKQTSDHRPLQIFNIVSFLCRIGSKSVNEVYPKKYH